MLFNFSEEFQTQSEAKIRKNNYLSNVADAPGISFKQVHIQPC